MDFHPILDYQPSKMKKAVKNKANAISTIFLDIFCNPKTHETAIQYLSYSWYPSIHSLPLRYLISVF
jgi:hypothetical protein